jgi:hypothetical protein
MYKYLRLNESHYQDMHEFGATIFFVLKNQQSVDIVKWFVLKVLFENHFVSCGLYVHWKKIVWRQKVAQLCVMVDK